jgi:hypothetical protein
MATMRVVFPTVPVISAGFTIHGDIFRANWGGIMLLFLFLAGIDVSFG